MHPYYSKKKDKYFREIAKILSYGPKETEDLFGEKPGLILKEVQDVFVSEFLADLPFVGGNNNPNDTSNLVGCCEYAAFFVTGSMHGISNDDVGRLLTILESRHYKPLPSFLRAFIRKLIKIRLTQSVLKMMADKSRKYSDMYPYAWIYQYKKPDELYSHRLNCTRCGAYIYLKSKGLADIMPYLCNIDHVVFAAYGLPYYRTQIIAAGDKCCNNQFKRDSEPLQDHWPPHVLKKDGFK